MYREDHHSHITPRTSEKGYVAASAPAGLSLLIQSQALPQLS